MPIDMYILGSCQNNLHLQDVRKR